MSYILESLKKSEKERREQAVDSPIDQVYDSTLLESPERESHKKKHHFMILLIALLAAVIVGSVAIIMMMSRSTDPIVEPASIVENNARVSEAENDRIKNTNIDNLYQQLEREKRQARERIRQVEAANKENLKSVQTDISNNSEERSEKSVDIGKFSITPVKELKEDQAIIPSFNQLSMLSKDNLPTINYSAHVFAEDNRNGFVVINGQKQRVGSKLSNGIYLEKIEQDAIILSYDGLVFKMPAMTSWINK